MESNANSPLTSLGYSPREAVFLRMVAMHSGVFLRRQFVAYTGAGQGQAAQALVAKLTKGGHGRGIGFGDKTVYQVTHKGLYRLLGIEDSNNRRARSGWLMKARLMALDFILGHTDKHFLETEAEKSEFFRQHFGATDEQLPRAIYPARSAGERPAIRYFVEKFPIFVAASAPDVRPDVAFSFVDDGQATISSFAAFLHRYGSLMKLVPRFRLYYITDAESKFSAARRQFERLIAGSVPPNGPGNQEALLRYFELLKRWQEGATRFSKTEFADLARLRRAYGGLEYEALFEKWLVNSFSVLSADSEGPQIAQASGRFVPALLPHDYGFLGDLRRMGWDAKSFPQSGPRSEPQSPSDGTHPTGVAAFNPRPKPQTGQPTKHPATKPHAGSDPVVTGFATPASAGGQSSAFPRARSR